MKTNSGGHENLFWKIIICHKLHGGMICRYRISCNNPYDHFFNTNSSPSIWINPWKRKSAPRSCANDALNHPPMILFYSWDAIGVCSRLVFCPIIAFFWETIPWTNYLTMIHELLVTRRFSSVCPKNQRVFLFSKKSTTNNAHTHHPFHGRDDIRTWQLGGEGGSLAAAAQRWRWR